MAARGPSEGPPRKLPEPGRSYLADPSLCDVWNAVRVRLERGGLVPDGTVEVDLDEEAAQGLTGLFGGTAKRILAGRRRLDLAVLDQALRASNVQAGLVTVVEDLTGAPLVDRSAVRAKDAQDRSELTAALDAALSQAGCASAVWAGDFSTAVRRTGLLSRAGDEASVVVTCLGRVLRELVVAGTLPLDAPLPDDAPTNLTGDTTAAPLGELGELATRCCGNAHALDDDKILSHLVLRAAALALGLQRPETSAQKRALWEQVGVSPDTVSGTVLVWDMRPAGDDAWSSMMRQRADLGLVTHLTMQELERAGVLEPSAPVRPSAPDRCVPACAKPGSIVWACENPQVLQAAARAGTPGPLLCTAGNPSAVGWRLLHQLVGTGVEVRYHGDFDWPGVSIAGRLYAMGVHPWRMTADDYRAAAGATDVDSELSLGGREAPTDWDPDLATAMRTLGVAVHEEAMTSVLLADLRRR
jgi:uncharacterized protein (TIGR02679 family)